MLLSINTFYHKLNIAIICAYLLVLVRTTLFIRKHIGSCFLYYETSIYFAYDIYCTLNRVYSYVLLFHISSPTHTMDSI